MREFTPLEGSVIKRPGGKKSFIRRVQGLKFHPTRFGILFNWARPNFLGFTPLEKNTSTLRKRPKIVWGLVLPSAPLVSAVRNKFFNGVRKSSLMGFTLIETMVVTVVLCILLGAIYASLGIGRRAWQTQETEIVRQQELRKALLKMARELRQSGRQGIIELNNGITFCISTGYNQGQIEWSGPISYSLQADQIIRTSGDGSSSILANRIDQLRFERPKEDLINLRVGSGQFELKNHIKLRN